jgi:hypothetical protein
MNGDDADNTIWLRNIESLQFWGHNQIEASWIVRLIRGGMAQETGQLAQDRQQTSAPCHFRSTQLLSRQVPYHFHSKFWWRGDMKVWQGDLSWLLRLVFFSDAYGTPCVFRQFPEMP